MCPYINELTDEVFDSYDEAMENATETIDEFIDPDDLAERLLDYITKNYSNTDIFEMVQRYNEEDFYNVYDSMADDLISENVHEYDEDEEEL